MTRHATPAAAAGDYERLSAILGPGRCRLLCSSYGLKAVV